MSDDTVMVRPLKTFLEGPHLKHPESEPYQVSRPRMLELRGLGLVEHVEAGTAAAAPEDPAPVEPDALAVAERPAEPAAPADPVAPRRRGRPPGRRS